MTANKSKNMSLFRDYATEIIGGGIAAVITVYTSLSTFIGTVNTFSYTSDLTHELIKSIFVIVNSVVAALVIHLAKKYLENREKKSGDKNKPSPQS